jgi:hypothetical protein
MSSPYRHAVAALRERHDEVARMLGETDATLAKLSTERMRLRIELDSLEERLAVAVVHRPQPLDASPIVARAASDRRQRLGVLAATSSLVALGFATAFSEPDRHVPRNITCTDVPVAGCSTLKTGFTPEK